MKKTILLGLGLCLVLVIVMGSANASEYYEENTNVTLKVPCSNEGASCSVTATCKINILFPNSTTMITDASMDNLGGGYFVYNLSYVEDVSFQTTPTGDYDTTVFCIDGADKGISTFKYTITTNGKAPPTAVTIVMFSIAFIIIVCGLMGLLVKNVFSIIETKMDGWSLIYNLSAYFGLWVVYILSIEYLGNAFINDFLLWIIRGGSVAFVIMPFAGFMMWFIKENWEDGYKKPRE